MPRPRNEKVYESIYEYINTYNNKYSRSPSVREIAKIINLSVTSTQYHLNKMIEEGRLERKEGSRGIITKAIGQSKLSVPLIGVVACGSPIFAESNIEEYISVSKSLLGTGEFFALRAKGNSMIEAGINDGDIVFIRKQNSAEEGQIIVALIDDEATLKRFYKDKIKGQIRLHPENKTMEDIYVDNCLIQGIAIKVLKDIT